MQGGDAAAVRLFVRFDVLHFALYNGGVVFQQGSYLDLYFFGRGQSEEVDGAVERAVGGEVLVRGDVLYFKLLHAFLGVVRIAVVQVDGEGHAAELARGLLEVVDARDVQLYFHLAGEGQGSELQPAGSVGTVGHAACSGRGVVAQHVVRHFKVAYHGRGQLAGRRGDDFRSVARLRLQGVGFEGVQLLLSPECHCAELVERTVE